MLNWLKRLFGMHAETIRFTECTQVWDCEHKDGKLRCTISATPSMCREINKDKFLLDKTNDINRRAYNPKPAHLGRPIITPPPPATTKQYLRSNQCCHDHDDTPDEEAFVAGLAIGAMVSSTYHPDQDIVPGGGTFGGGGGSGSWEEEQREERSYASSSGRSVDEFPVETPSSSPSSEASSQDVGGGSDSGGD